MAGCRPNATASLNRAANLELIPSENTMLMRLQTYYNYGKYLKDKGEASTDPAEKADLAARAKTMFERAVEVGVAMTNNFVANANGFFYLSLAQLELGDPAGGGS